MGCLDIHDGRIVEDVERGIERGPDGRSVEVVVDVIFFWRSYHLDGRDLDYRPCQRRTLGGTQPAGGRLLWDGRCVLGGGRRVLVDGRWGGAEALARGRGRLRRDDP